MHIDRDRKLDFKDVLIRPKRSALPSRAEVDIIARIHLQALGRALSRRAGDRRQHGHGRHVRDGARAGAARACRSRCTSTTASTNWRRSSAALKVKSNAFYSMGITREDLDKFERVKRRAGDAIQYVCIDVANGYTESFVEFVAQVSRAPTRSSRSWPATSSPAR